MNTDHPHNPDPRMQRAIELISALCDERISTEQANELERLVLDDQPIRRMYLRLMHLDAGLHHYASALGVLPDHSLESTDALANQPAGMDETMMLNAMPAAGFVEDEEDEERFQPAPVLAPPTQNSSTGLSYIKRGIAALLLVGLGIGAYLLLSSRSIPPARQVATSRPITPSGIAVYPTDPGQAPPAVVATLDLISKAVWESNHLPPFDGNFRIGQSLVLSSGVVQLKLQHGAKMVVEGPADLRFTSESECGLQNGRIVATVPGGGLTIRCPNGTVTDLGTEFGVAVNQNSGTEVAVFQGRVAAALTSTATTEPTGGLVLGSGQAAVMTRKAVTLNPQGAMQQRYICSLSNAGVNSLDVADLICGGDGTTKRRGIGVDPTTGAVGNLRPTFAMTSDGKYHRANGYPFIDGAFIADNARGSMIVDSAGDHFHFTGLGSTSYNSIFTGGKIPWPETPAPDTVLNGVDYSTADHSIICIHPNNGITLDLNAVRRIYPDRVIKGFHCRVGISGTAKRKDPKIPDAAVVVLADGVLRFQNPHFTIFDGSFDVNVPLKETDRFITLVSTYAGPGNYHNWVLWVDARLDLSAGH